MVEHKTPESNKSDSSYNVDFVASFMMRSLPYHKLGLGHVDCRLIMWEPQSDKINIIVAG